MAVVPVNAAIALPVASPKEIWDSDAKVVRFGKNEGDFEEQRKVVERIRELGLLENKVYIERQLMTRLEQLMSQKDDLYGILNKYRRKRPLKDRLNATISEIRKLIHPSITRDSSGKKLEYHVSVLMGYFTANVRYHIDERCHLVVLLGEIPHESETLSKEVTLEFPREVDFSRVAAQYSGGVFKVSVPYGRSSPNSSSCDEHSLLSSNEADSESLPSTDCQSVTSLDDVIDGVTSPLSDDSGGTWV